MGIFNSYNDHKHGNQRISANYLKKLGFKKSNQWGAPVYWGINTEFWEKIIIQENEYGLYPHSATIWYFPETFTGYVTAFAGEGANKVIAMVNGTLSTTNDYSGSALCKNDIQFAIDLMNQKLIEYNKL